MPRVNNSVIERVLGFRAAWRELAADSSFAGMTLAEFEEATESSVAIREEVRSLSTQLGAKKAARSIADMATVEVLDLVVNSVRGTPGFGPDCGLYRAFGYVRKSERKSGLTRPGSSPAADADVA